MELVVDPCESFSAAVAFKTDQTQSRHPLLWSFCVSQV